MLMIEPFRDGNGGLWSRLNVLRRDYFRGSIAELRGYGLRPALALNDFPRNASSRLRGRVREAARPTTRWPVGAVILKSFNQLRRCGCRRGRAAPALTVPRRSDISPRRDATGFSYCGAMIRRRPSGPPIGPTGPGAAAPASRPRKNLAQHRSTVLQGGEYQPLDRLGLPAAGELGRKHRLRKPRAAAVDRD